MSPKPVSGKIGISNPSLFDPPSYAASIEMERTIFNSGLNLNYIYEHKKILKILKHPNDSRTYVVFSEWL